MKPNYTPMIVSLAIVAAVLMIGCTPNAPGAPPIASNIQNPRVVVIDGCEYIFADNSLPGGNNYAMALAHKGNCKNPIHIYANSK